VLIFSGFHYQNKKRKMRKITRPFFTGVYRIVFHFLFLFFVVHSATAQDSSLPFTISITKMPLDSLPDYLTQKGPDQWMDFPVSTAMINGSFWVMFKNGETKPVFRYKGSNFENAKRQTNGTIYTPVSRPYILGGMWYDSADKKLYAPMHCETRGYYTTILRQIHLASSSDMGETWKYEGPIITRDDPNSPLPTGRETSGLYWDGGEGDFFIYVDKREGYIYLYTNSYTWPKPGIKAPYFFRHHVARCKISDKMAPGKWQKFYRGTWSEPGLGGKASGVNAYYVMYNTYLGKYVSFNYDNSISVCTDLSKQDWTPCFKIKGDYWGGTKSFAWLVTDSSKTNSYCGGNTLFLYAYWEKKFSGLYKIVFGSGQTSDSLGYVVGFAKEPEVSAGTSKLYLYGSQYDSPDSMESNHYRRISSLNPGISYSAGWKAEKNDNYYGKTAMVNETAESTIQFSFKGKDIYWRCVKGPDGGKADVYIDNLFQKTVDCWASPATPFQFAFIKRGLDSNKIHTIKIIVSGDKNKKSSGTKIRNLLFEYTAESYQASDGFSSVMGKNNWYYLQKTGGIYTNMIFKDPLWVGYGGSEVGYFDMTTQRTEAVRKWIAPNAGIIRVEGDIRIGELNTGVVKVEIQKNNKNIWTSKLVKSEEHVSHDFTVHVKKGDAVYFIVKKNKKSTNEKVAWNPSITYKRD
jgi:hypothetical protein